MNRVHLASEFSTENLNIVGVGVYKDTKHIGILCRDSSDKKLRFIHLASHLNLKVDDDVTKCYLWIETKLDEEPAAVAAAQARRVFRKYQLGGIPYGFSPYTGYFGAKGEIRWTAPGNGLSCATFVLAVFDSAGVRLVKGETWPINREDDKTFQSLMIQTIRISGNATTAHIKGMKDDIGQVRFRVLEVAGAVAAEVYPAEFSVAEANGYALQLMIDGASQRPPAQSM